MKKIQLTIRVFLTNMCNRYITATNTYYKWKNRHLENWMDGFRG